MTNNLYCLLLKEVLEQLCRKVNSHCYRNSSLKAVPAKVGYGNLWASKFFSNVLLDILLDILDACGQIHRLRSCAALSTYFLAVLGRYYAGFSLVAWSESYCLVGCSAFLLRWFLLL